MRALFETIVQMEFIMTAIELSVPLVLAALAALITNKAGILNIGIEGSMLMGALMGAVVGYQTGSVMLGLLAAIAIGAFLGLLMSVFVNKFKINHILVGIAFNLLAAGLAIFIIYVRTGTKGDHPSVSIPTWTVPYLSDLPIVGPLLFGQNLMVYLTVVAAVVIAVVLSRTKLGMHIKAVGENVEAAESVGINAFKIQSYALLIGGVLAGLGGAFMSMAYMSTFNTGMIAGRGFIGIAAESMGAGIVGNTVLASAVFGFVNTFAVTAQVTLRIPFELLNTLPYLVTILALVIYAMRKRRKQVKQP